MLGIHTHLSKCGRGKVGNSRYWHLETERCFSDLGVITKGILLLFTVDWTTKLLEPSLLPHTHYCVTHKSETRVDWLANKATVAHRSCTQGNNRHNKSIQSCNHRLPHSAAMNDCRVSNDTREWLLCCKTYLLETRTVARNGQRRWNWKVEVCPNVVTVLAQVQQTWTFIWKLTSIKFVNQGGKLNFLRHMCSETLRHVFMAFYM